MFQAFIAPVIASTVEKNNLLIIYHHNNLKTQIIKSYKKVAKQTYAVVIINTKKNLSLIKIIKIILIL